jgi:hypothetical protein
MDLSPYQIFIFCAFTMVFRITFQQKYFIKYLAYSSPPRFGNAVPDDGVIIGNFFLR